MSEKREPVEPVQLTFADYLARKTREKKKREEG